jgi:hypothetical protein
LDALRALPVPSGAEFTSPVTPRPCGLPGGSRGGLFRGPLGDGLQCADGRLDVAGVKLVSPAELEALRAALQRLLTELGPQ